MNWGMLSAFAASLTWAIGVNVYTDLSSKYQPSQINFSRALVATPLFLMAAILYSIFDSKNQSSIQHIPLMNYGWLAVSCVSSYALGDLLFFRSSQSALKVTGALAIASIYPIWSAIVGFVFFKQTLQIAAILGLLIVVAGTVGVILASHEKSEHPHKLGIGKAAIFALTVSFFWALNSFSIGQLVSQNVFSANTVRMSFALVLCPIFGRLILGPTKIIMERQDFLKALPIFIFEGFGGSLFYVYGLSHTSLATGAVLTSLAPVLSVPIYFLRHRELPSVGKSISIAMVVIGLWLMLV